MGCVISDSRKKDQDQIVKSHALSSATNDLDEKCSDNNFQDCKHLLNLRELLHYYYKWMLTQSKTSSEEEEKLNNIGIYEYISNNESFSISILLHNYHHLMNIHSSAFEQIYDFFIESYDDAHAQVSCSIESCHMMNRNHRDRSNNSNNDRNRSQIYYNHRDFKEVITQQFLDQIHCYIYHQFDSGFKLTKEDLQEIEIEIEIEIKNDMMITSDDEDMKTDRKRERIGKIIQEKKKQIRTVRNRARKCRQRKDSRESIESESESESEESLEMNNSKFMSNVIKHAQPSKINHPMYSFGVRYYYDTEKKDDEILDVEYNIGYTYKHWYIALKYENLKDELLNNLSENLSKEQHIDLKTKAKYYQKTEHVKSHCGDISIDNLICIMVYCNFDTFQSEYTKTYRHQLQESDQQLKERHREFAYFGKILQETVENNGITVENGKTKTFYHGINIELMFTSTLHKFCGPISTSSQYEVALLFTNAKGIVLELNDGTLLSQQHNAIYFDCEFISDFSHEKERFFIGGRAPLKIISIYDVKSNQFYGVYLKLINILLSIVHGDSSINETKVLNERNQNAIVKLLKHELKISQMPTIPKYVNDLLHSICLNVKFFTTRYSKTFDSSNHNIFYSKYTKIAQFLCCDDCHLFNLTILTKAFPNLRSIAIECSSLTPKVFENILGFLDNNQSNLQDIVFKFPMSGLSFGHAQNKYETQFEKLKWTINIINETLVIAKNKSQHDRQTSVNIAQFKMISMKTERLNITKSIDTFIDYQ